MKINGRKIRQWIGRAVVLALMLAVVMLAIRKGSSMRPSAAVIAKSHAVTIIDLTANPKPHLPVLIGLKSGTTFTVGIVSNRNGFMWLDGMPGPKDKVVAGNTTEESLKLRGGDSWKIIFKPDNRVAEVVAIVTAYG